MVPEIDTLAPGAVGAGLDGGTAATGEEGARVAGAVGGGGVAVDRPSTNPTVRSPTANAAITMGFIGTCDRLLFSV